MKYLLFGVALFSSITFLTPLSVYACTKDSDCPGSAAGSCNVSTGICSTPSDTTGTGKGFTPTAVSPTTAVPTAAAPTATPSADNTSTGFVSLTKIPVFQDAGNSAQLPTFLNNIYKICIGLAAVLAVLQIVRAGLLFMLEGGNFVEKKEARQLITQSIVGLLLVLSPVIVFSIINPKILSLTIDTTGLQVQGGGASGNTFTTATQQVLWTDTSSSRTDSQTKCTAAGGTAVFTCQVPGSGSARNVPITQACKPGEDGITVCKASTDAPNSASSCTAQYANIEAKPSGQACAAADGYDTIPSGCCSGITTGGMCCGQQITAAGSEGGLGGACFSDGTCSGAYVCTTNKKCAVDPDLTHPTP